MPDTLYDRILVEMFRRHDGVHQSEFEFNRDEIGDIARAWGERLRNPSDVTYSYRGGRRPLPPEISDTGNWVIEG